MTPGLEVDHGAGVLLGELDHVLLYELSHPVARSVTLCHKQKYLINGSGISCMDR